MAFYLKTESAGTKTHTRRSSCGSKNAYRLLQVENPGLRFYSANLARWISRDPIGIRGGSNVYGFARNQPVRRIDKLGLAPGDVNEWSNVSCKIPKKLVTVTSDIKYSSFSFGPKYKWMEVLTEISFSIEVAGNTVEGEPDSAPLIEIPWGNVWMSYNDGQAAVEPGVSCRRKYVCKATCESDCCGKKTKELYDKYVPGKVVSDWKPTAYTPEQQPFLDPDAPKSWLWEHGSCVVYSGEEEKFKKACEKKAKESCKGQETSTYEVPDWP